MLHRLYIQNYAIIDEISIDFSSGLNIITGETGAGKSILMGALSLILGERSGSNTLLNKEKKCVIEGYFKTKDNQQVKAFLKLNELDSDEELLVRREISVNGKSRAFINDTPVSVTQLKELGSVLVDLHQQFDTLELGDNDFQRAVVDALAGNSESLSEFTLVFTAYSKANKELTALRLEQHNAQSTLDYNQFLFDELEEAGLHDNELEQLDAEIKLLGNAENIKQQLSSIYTPLTTSETPIVQQLKSLSNKLQYLEQYHTSIADLNTRLRSAQMELQDIGDELERIDEGVQYSPERIQWVNDKLSAGYKLLKKHAVSTTADLLAIKASLEEKLTAVVNISEAIEGKEQEVKQLLHRCGLLAAEISSKRHKTANPLAEKVNSLLAQVGMPNARIQLRVMETPLHSNGIDTIDFLLDANKSGRFEILGKVASGGELSRIMLCIKSLVARKLQLPTLIFDEIDTGISGEAAKQVGAIMKDLSGSHQLISITHQPQIAAKAAAHYFVYKAVQGNKITTSIRLLDEPERINAIAQMLSGEKPTAAALENAREMCRGN